MYFDRSKLEVGDRVGISPAYDHEICPIGKVTKIGKQRIDVLVKYKHGEVTIQFAVSTGQRWGSGDSWHRANLISAEDAAKNNVFRRGKLRQSKVLRAVNDKLSNEGKRMSADKLEKILAIMNEEEKTDGS